MEQDSWHYLPTVQDCSHITWCKFISEKNADVHVVLGCYRMYPSKLNVRRQTMLTNHLLSGKFVRTCYNVMRMKECT
jgi:hypothetical protein